MGIAYVEYTGKDNRYNSNGFVLNDGLCPLEYPGTSMSHTGINIYTEGFFYTVAGITAPNQTLVSNTSNTYLDGFVKRIRIHLPGGQSHELRAADAPILYDATTNPSQLDMSGTYYSVDGSKLRYEENGSTRRLYMADGSFYDFASGTTTLESKTIRKATKFTDVNGNKLTYYPANSSYPYGYWKDTLNRTIPVPMPLDEPTSAGTVTYNLPGKGGASMTYKFTWRKLKDTTAANSALTNFNQALRHLGDYKSGPPAPAPPRSASEALFHSDLDDWAVSADATPKFNPIVLTAVERPDGKKYEFSYNIYGEIEKVKYPTGSEEEFTFGEVESLSNFSPGEQHKPQEEANRGVVTRKIKERSTAIPQTWTFASTGVVSGGIHKLKVTTTAPDNSRVEQDILKGKQPCSNCPYGDFGFGDVFAGLVSEQRTYGTNGQMTSRSLTEWIKKEIAITNYSSSYPKAERDPRVAKSVSILFEGGQSTALATLSTTEYDDAGSTDPARFAHINPKRTKSYHYKSLNLTTAQTADIATIAGTFSSSGLAAVSETDYSYASNYLARGIPSLPIETRALNPTNLSDVLGKTQIKYDESAYPILNAGSTTGWVNPGSTLRGNATTNRTWVKETNTWIETHAQYDNFGNPRKAWDAKGNVAETQYSSTYKYAYATKTISAVPDPTNVYGSNTAFQTTTTYDFTTGLTLSTTDANGLVSTMEYNDVLLRPTAIVAPNGARTETSYGDTPSNIWVKTRSQFDTSIWVESTTYADNLGRGIKTKKKDSNGDIFTETEYDNMNRVKRVTNPYRAGQTKLWSLTTYDEEGRVKETFTPVASGTGQSLGTKEYGFSTAANAIGTYVVGIDASGRKMRSITNALGQLIRVDEATSYGGTTNADLGAVTSPKQPTYYTFDVFGNMIRVQQGAQYRHFKYDALGRLIRVRQPEQEVNTALNTSGNPYNNQWTAGFTYDANGNLLTTTDAKGVTITNSYDNLNRVKTRSYSDATPSVTYKYDKLAKAKGALIETSNSVSTSKTTQFDTWGRPLTFQQITDGVTYTSQYKYNLSGALTEETYPTGRKVKNDFDANGDILKIHNLATAQSAAKTFADNFKYMPDGRIERLKVGNGLWEAAKFNNRLQVTEIGLGVSATNLNLWKINLEYGELNTNGTVNTAKNTGNIAKQTTTGGGKTYLQTYKYDSLYRIIEAKEKTGSYQNWKQTFGYDRYGNRTAFTQVVGSSNLPINNHTRPTISAATNRFNNGQGYLYDKAGNVIKDPENRTYTFNGDNKQTQVKNSSNQVIGTYFYDGDGKRIKKVTATETTTFVYSGGKKVAEYSSKVPMPYPTTKYVATDTLGSIRAITNQFGQVLSRRDFMPFGEELYAGTPNRSTSQKYAVGDDNVREKFTGYERDVETGLDFAEARYYKNNHGRFTAVDPLLASGKSANPQTFNRYAYVGSSPLRFIDPSGMQAAETVDTIYSKARQAYVDLLTYFYDTRGSTPYSRSTYSPSGGRRAVTRFENGYISTGLEGMKRNRSSAFVQVSTPTNTTPRNYFGFPTKQQVDNVRDGINTIDQTGLFNAMETGHRASTGQATQIEAIAANGGMLLNFLPGGKQGKAATKSVALGVERVGGKLPLQEIAETTGASIYKNWARDGLTRRPVSGLTLQGTQVRFGRAFNQATQRADKIHFALDGIIDGIGVDNAFQLGRKGFTDRNFTNAEFFNVMRDPVLLNKTQFYLNNKPIQIPTVKFTQ